MDFYVLDFIQIIIIIFVILLNKCEKRVNVQISI